MFIKIKLNDLIRIVITNIIILTVFEWNLNLQVEQKLAIAMKISHRVYVMGHGQIVFEGTPKELESRDDIRKEWLEV